MIITTGRIIERMNHCFLWRRVSNYDVNIFVLTNIQTPSPQETMIHTVSSILGRPNASCISWMYVKSNYQSKNSVMCDDVVGFRQSMPHFFY